MQRCNRAVPLGDGANGNFHLPRALPPPGLSSSPRPPCHSHPAHQSPASIANGLPPLRASQLANDAHGASSRSPRSAPSAASRAPPHLSSESPPRRSPRSPPHLPRKWRSKLRRRPHLPPRRLPLLPPNHPPHFLACRPRNSSPRGPLCCLRMGELAAPR